MLITLSREVKMEIRTNIHIISDLLKYAVDCQWSDRYDISTCSCCGTDYYDCCPECNNFKYVPDENRYKKYQSENETHKNDCPLFNLIKEARAVIQAENEIRFKNNEELIDTY